MKLFHLFVVFITLSSHMLLLNSMGNAKDFMIANRDNVTQEMVSLYSKKPLKTFLEKRRNEDVSFEVRQNAVNFLTSRYLEMEDEDNVAMKKVVKSALLRIAAEFKIVEILEHALPDIYLDVGPTIGATNIDALNRNKDRERMPTDMPVIYCAKKSGKNAIPYLVSFVQNSDHDAVSRMQVAALLKEIDEDRAVKELNKLLLSSEDATILFGAKQLIHYDIHPHDRFWGLLGRGFIKRAEDYLESVRKQ